MDERVLQLLEGLTVDVKGIKSTITDLQGQVTNLETKMNKGFEQVDQRFNLMDQRFEQVDQRFNLMDQRFEQVDQRFDSMDQRFDRVDHLLEGIGGQFEHQTKMQLDKDSVVAQEFTLIKSRIFDLESRFH